MKPRTLATAAICLLMCGAAWASDDWGHQFDAVIAEPGVTVSFGRKGEEETRKIDMPNGVSFVQTRSGGRMSGVTGVDNSKHGAVLCQMGLLLYVRGQLSTCPSPSSVAEIAELDAQVDRIVDFAVINGIPPNSPETRSSLRAEIERYNGKISADLAKLPADKVAATCRSEKTVELIGKLRSEFTGAKLKSHIDDLLSVPRPPVVNPCM